MAIDVFGEEIVNLSQAARRLPKIRNGKHPSPSTLYRWISAGKQGPDGCVVHLEFVKVGGTTCTSIEALQRYFDRLTGEPSAITVQRKWSKMRLQHIKAAEAYLDKEGI